MGRRASAAHSEPTKHGSIFKVPKPLTEALGTSRTAQLAVRKTINERTLSGAALEDLRADLMDELRELNEDMKAFKLLNRPLYDDYLQARKIINSGGGAARRNRVRRKFRQDWK